MENTNKIHQKVIKITTEKEIYAATFFGGPLAAGYLLSENFKVFGDLKKSKLSLIGSVVVTIVGFAGLLMMPDTIKIPSYIIPLIYSTLAYSLAQYLQKEEIKKHLQSGGLGQKWYRTLGVALLALVITLVLVALPLAILRSFLSPQPAVNTEQDYEQKLAESVQNAERTQDLTEYANASSFSLLTKKYDLAVKYGEISCNGKNGSGCYNLACAFCLKGDQDKAMEFLEKSYQLKIGTEKLMKLNQPEKDSDLNCLKDNAKFHQFLVKVYDGEPPGENK